MKSDEDPLVSIAQAVADGEEIDWNALLVSHPHLVDSIRNLQRIGCFSETFQHELDTKVEGGRAPRTWGQLKILEKIGEGSFGEVFRAEDSVLERNVALKLRRPMAEGELTSYQLHLHEARRMARIRHPNVLAVHGVEVHDGRPGIWSDFVEGTTLEAVLETAGPFSQDALQQVTLDLACALAAVHEAGLVHGDVKTANVMRQTDGHIILMDFGAGRIHRPDPVSEGRPSGGSGFRAEGTPIAMAPEVLAGDVPSPAADIYSLGVLVYRLATGRHPVEAETLPDLLERVSAGAQVPLGEARPDLPETFIGIVERMLRRLPEERPRSANQVETELKLALDRPDLGSSAGSAHPHNLPEVSHRLIGRRKELLEASRALEPSRSVVSLIGTGGSGKTRLALAIAHLFLNHHRDGVWWIDLTTVKDDVGIAQQMSRSLGIRSTSVDGRFETVERYLRSGDRLLVFDNVEQISEDCAQWIARLRETCPSVRFLVTSRVPLKLPAEIELRLASLSIPPLPSETTSVGTEINQFESVRLFIERVNDVRPGFVLSQVNAETIARICRRLDGIPLALELAAARVRTFSLEELARRLEENFRMVLGRGGNETPTAHETLQASIDWSYELLSEAERQLFGRLAVFRGGWTLDGAEKVCFLDVPDAEEGSSGDGAIADALASLVEQSLVVFQPEQNLDAERYHMLEMVRDTAQRRLGESSEEANLSRQHLAFFCDLSRVAKGELMGPEGAAWFARLRQEHGNIERALDFETTDRESTEEAMVLFESSARSWVIQGLTAFGIQRAEEVLARPHAQNPTPYRAAVFTWLGMMREATGDHDGAVAAHETNQQISAANGDSRSVAVAHFNIATSLTRTGRLDEAYESQRLSLEGMESLGDESGIAFALGGMAMVEQYRGNFEEALASQQRALAIERRLRSAHGVALNAHNVATTLVFLKRFDEAELYVREALELRRAEENKLGVASSVGLLGSIEADRGNHRAALQFCQESLTIRLAIGAPGEVLICLERALDLAVDLAKMEEAAILLAASRSLRVEHGVPTPQNLAVELAGLETKMIDHLGEERFEMASRRGGLMRLEDAASFALELEATD